MRARLACIVEGYGEVEAVPVLVRRIAERLDPAIAVHVPKPIRQPRNKVVKPGELERAVVLAIGTVAAEGAVLILLDSDDDCPAHLGPELLRRAQRVDPRIPMSVVLAKREFEAWFLAAAHSLAGRRRLPTDLRPPPNPEDIRGSKQWLSRQMPLGQPYSETVDQAALAAIFDKCFRDITTLLNQVAV